MNRRDFHRFGTVALGSVMGLVLAVPGVAYILDPLRKRSKAGEFRTVARLEQLAIGVPQSFAIVDDRQDAWVRYPEEPIGSVWLVRQPDGATPRVVAFTSECPHLGCAVNLTKDKASQGLLFLCPCHDSAFSLAGEPRNKIPPRGMDTLETEVSGEPDPTVRVKFERFRTMSKEKIRLG